MGAVAGNRQSRSGAIAVWLAVVAVGCGGGGSAAGALPCDPHPEVCDGRDNDCNGHVDDVPGAGAACGEGACGGMMRCVGASLACVADTDASVEACNGVDDDCDGTIDDGLEACACTGGAAPRAETCNGIDDDCNGTIDEALTGCACTDGGERGVETCNRVDDDCNGMIDDGLTDCPCAGGASGSAERCNGIDDDCDGRVDDGVPRCACSDGPRRDEICNDVDDDCDGTIDDGLTACACTGGSASMEVCNAIDDDCDGMVDETGPRGTCGQMGDPCTDDGDCVSGVCVDDGTTRTCSVRCAPDGTCPMGWTCRDTPAPPTCVPFYAPCGRNADCPAGQVCTVQETADHTRVVTECRTTRRGGAHPGEACAGTFCENSSDRGVMCGATETCSAVCTANADCPAGNVCDVADMTGSMAPVRDCASITRVGFCRIGCGGDADCPAALALHCQPGLDVALTGIQGICSTFDATRTPTGGACPTGTGFTCEHSLCFNNMCTQVCADDGDCAVAGWTCQPSMGWRLVCEEGLGAHVCLPR